MVDRLSRVHIEASSKCNSRCPMCSRYTATGFVQPNLVQKNLSLRVFTKFFDSDKTKQVESVSFSGVFGDPCLNEHLPDFLSILAKRKIQVSIDTNGGFHSVDWWRSLAHPNVSINFSIDGLEDTNHLYRRNVKWAKVWENLNAFLDNGGRGSWTFIAFAHNEHQIDTAKEMAAQLGLEFRLKITQKFRNFENWSVFENGIKLYDLYPPVNPELRHTNLGSKQHFPEMDTFEFPSIYKSTSEFDNREINCLIKKRSELFLASTGHLLPCCYLGTIEHDSPGAYQFRNFFDLQTVDLHRVSVDVAIESLRSIEKTWSRKSVADGKLITCARTCGKGLANRVKYVQA